MLPRIAASCKFASKPCCVSGMLLGGWTRGVARLGANYYARVGSSIELSGRSGAARAVQIRLGAFPQLGLGWRILTVDHFLSGKPHIKLLRPLSFGGGG